ncbi:MAG: DUF6519 domain-containing protein [Actinomycetota bacterium]
MTNGNPISGGGDYTRFTFDPSDDHAAVFMQQGRVMLDADFNELAAIVDRRLRAETIDVIGRCTVPRETPEAFRIDLAGGALTIGHGRLYADGLLAENRGAEPSSTTPRSGRCAAPSRLRTRTSPTSPPPPRWPPFRRAAAPTSPISTCGGAR